MSGTTVRASAPLRISFVGGGTDFPHYFERNGGAVLSATIDHRARVDAAPRGDRQVTIRSVALGRLVEYALERGPVYDGVMDLPKAAIARVGTRVGLDIDIASDAPPGSGLGGSSALVTACVAALAALEGRSLSRFEVARLAYAIERGDLGIAGGWQDQFATAFGGINLIEFSADGVTVTPVELDDAAREELAGNLLLCYTGRVRTDLGLIDAQIRMYREGREDTIVGMKELHELAYELREAIEGRDLPALGGLLRRAYENKKRMNPHVVEGAPIERLMRVALDAGAAGGKICGAGGGGYLLLACEPRSREDVRDALEAHGGRVAGFRFGTRGVEARVGDTVWTPT